MHCFIVPRAPACLAAVLLFVLSRASAQRSEWTPPHVERTLSLPRTRATAAALESPTRTMASPRRELSTEPGWEDVGAPRHEQLPVLPWPDDSDHRMPGNITLQDRIGRLPLDERELRSFFPVPFSHNWYDTHSKLYAAELASLEQHVNFDALDQEDRIDYLLLKNLLQRKARELEHNSQRDREAAPLLPFAPELVVLCEAHYASRFQALDPKHIADVLHNATAAVAETVAQIKAGKLLVSKEAARRAIENIHHLQGHVQILYDFFAAYHPTFDWWVKAPFASWESALEPLLATIAAKWADTRPDGGGDDDDEDYDDEDYDDDDDIIGEPIGRDRLLDELAAEMIPYTPKELLTIAEDKYAWCVQEMKSAAAELGFGGNWKAALRHVQAIYVEPGQQPPLIKSLVDSATAYVKRHDLVSVPPLAEKWRMSMMSADAQKVNPFFLGGSEMVVSYPTVDMAHADKLMSMRGNGPHLSKAVAFHEMIPGHHLQGFVAGRSRAYRGLFSTSFYTEGWAVYWELLFWDRGDFFESPEDKMGTLFWRAHRCVRILFSIKFHLGQLTPQQCVDMLVDMGGHERATAEGEVRRSLAGDYDPLYQAGYYLGAMQLYALREEVLGKGVLGEKEFHDRILQANQMPIELLRALLLGEELSKEYTTKWRFYDRALST